MYLTKIIYLFIIIFSISIPLITHAYGDGLASEVLPPSVIGNKNVTLSIGSTPFLIDSNHTGTQLGIILLDATTQQPIPQATIAISAFKGDNSLFGHIFQSDGGNFVLSFYPQPSGDILVNELGNPISSFFGQHSGIYSINGPVFNSAGLYHFKMEVLTMSSYDNQISKSFNAAISIPEYDKYAIVDNKYGKQQIQVIAYYDQINNFKYDPATRFINFSMPFDWSKQNIDSLSILHQEIQVPRAFGDYIVTKYDAYVNNIKLPDKALTIDDYSSDTNRVVHIILYKQEVQNLLSELKNPEGQMTFSLRPNTENAFPVVQLTRNAQFKVALSWDPPKILAGDTTTFNFKILDPSQNQTVSGITYDFSVLEGKNGVIYHQVGKTTSSPSGDNIAVPFPSNYTGAVTIAFENLKDNSF
ncbi:MAG TPA: hypothetical protein VEJ68_05280, partial [Candidatus Bathyarchaeia archaeon]|nr:hypothetical protein [Candidatus Bathyarchaeia archaeon]